MRILLVFLLSFPLQIIAQNKISFLRMERTPCFGKCPHYKVEIHSNGLILYEGIKHGNFFGHRKAQVDPKKVAKLFKEIGKYKLISLKNMYKPKAADLPRLHFDFSINKKGKRITNAESGPLYLSTIGKKIDSFIVKAKWTRDEEAEFGMEETFESIGMVDEGITKNPEFPGGNDALMSFLRNNLQYPQIAKENGIEGKVICRFLVKSDGSIGEATILRGIGFGCDEEALRVINAMPTWTPAMKRNQKIAMMQTVPIDFVLK